MLLVLAFQGPVLLAVGVAMLVPLLVAVWDSRGAPPRDEASAYILPALLALALGRLLHHHRPAVTSLPKVEALLITTAAWLTAGVFGAMPFVILLRMAPVEALFESVSGFTTAGATMLSGLDQLPRSALLWRSLTQYLGGLGILLIVLLLRQSRGSQALSLLTAEGVKVSSGRLSLNFRRAAYRFAAIYVVLTAAEIVVLMLLKVSLYDSVSLALTTISTGGFAPHDESIAFFRNRPDVYPGFVAIEAVIVFFMIAGGTNFAVLYRVGRGQLSALWGGLEVRLMWFVLGAATAVVAVNSAAVLGGSMPDWLMRSGFEVASLVSTTGFETTASGEFPRLSREVIMALMIIGGCAGSTAGGIKLIRVGILTIFLRHEIRYLRLPSRAVDPPRIDGEVIPDSAFRQAAFILLLWLAYVAVTGFAISGLAPHLSLSEAYSTALAAIGVFGPSFATVAEVASLPGSAKLLLIGGMLAGRLEILPLLVFLNPAAWRQ
ncbi:MAG: TrkH family potassium uptake protein [Anaerolineae bacterium]